MKRLVDTAGSEFAIEAISKYRASVIGDCRIGGHHSWTTTEAEKTAP